MQEAGYPNREHNKSIKLALVLAIIPLYIVRVLLSYFASVVFMNFLRYLCRYLFPRVKTPSTRLARPIAIPAYISEEPISLLLSSK